MAEVKFAGVNIPYITDSIDKNKERNYQIQNFVGNTGGNDVEYISTAGTVLSFQSIVSKENQGLLTQYRNLAKNYTKKPGVLVGSSDLQINGNYYLTGYREEKKVNGSYTVYWEFVEYLKPNTVQASFKRIGRTVTKQATKKALTTTQKTKAKTTSNYITILLRDCGTLRYGMTGSKCVKYLQKFLQKKGYYKGYLIDGRYLKYTRQEVAKFQKAYKIKVSKANEGQWDKVTREYWRKKYNITNKK